MSRLPTELKLLIAEQLHICNLLKLSLVSIDYHNVSVEVFQKLNIYTVICHCGRINLKITRRHATQGEKFTGKQVFDIITEIFEGSSDIQLFFSVLLNDMDMKKKWRKETGRCIKEKKWWIEVTRLKCSALGFTANNDKTPDERYDLVTQALGIKNKAPNEQGGS